VGAEAEEEAEAEAGEEAGEAGEEAEEAGAEAEEAGAEAEAEEGGGRGDDRCALRTGACPADRLDPLDPFCLPPSARVLWLDPRLDGPKWRGTFDRVRLTDSPHDLSGGPPF
jgi:hypothetical protein